MYRYKQVTQPHERLQVGFTAMCMSIGRSTSHVQDYRQIKPPCASYRLIKHQFARLQESQILQPCARIRVGYTVMCKAIGKSNRHIQGFSQVTQPCARLQVGYTAMCRGYRQVTQPSARLQLRYTAICKAIGWSQGNMQCYIGRLHSLLQGYRQLHSHLQGYSWQPF